MEGARCSPAMPSIWKKAKLGGLARLVSDLRISKRGRSDLPLQTGFPTSLADLVVKHRDRLKRSGRRRPKDRKAAAESCDDSRVRSEADSSSPSYEQSAPSSSPSTAVGEVVGVEIVGGGGFELRRDSPPVQDSSFSGEQGVCASEGVELVVEKTLSVCSAVFLISVFAFGTKVVAFLATALVLALLLMRFLKTRIRLLLSRRDELDRKTTDDTRARRLIDAKKKKEIRESTDEIMVIESTTQVPARRSGVVQIEVLTTRKEGPSHPKARWWKKLGSRRSGIPDCGKSSMIPPQPSLHLASELTGETAEIVETKEEEEEDEEEIESESETQLVLDKASAHVAMDTFCQGKKSYVGSVIYFILLALSGLVGGRIMALMLTVVCCLVTKLCKNIVQKCLQ